jgi:hypothetical protein
MTASLLLSLLAAGEPSLLEVLPPERLAALVARHPGAAALVFTEARERPIRHVDGVPAAWEARADQPPSFQGAAQPGECFVFQLGVYAVAAVGPLAVDFGPLSGDAARPPIAAAAQRCLSLGGRGESGRPLHKAISLAPGRLQALWCAIDVPLEAHGAYHGALDLDLGAARRVTVPLTLDVSGPSLPDHGDGEARRLSRLRWLDSDAGDEPTLTAPFTAVHTAGHRISVLGRELDLGEDGLPARLVSRFNFANTALLADDAPGTEVLAQPMAFVAETAGGPLAWHTTFGGLRRTDLEARWSATMLGDGARVEVGGRLDYTGSGELRLHLVAERDIELREARLEGAWRESAATWFSGLGHPGGRRPGHVQWRWDVHKRQDCFWLGAVHAGLMLRFKDAEYVRPPVNIYYHFRELSLPKSWGGGGIEIGPAADGMVPVQATSGPHTLKAGEALDFVCELYLTPFRTLDTDKQWATRFIHPGASHDPRPIDDALASCDAQRGPNVLNVHQATYYSPYINYPYSDDSFPALRDLVRRAHAKGVRVRVYYTTREITQNMPELFALHSFNGEIILPGPGRAARTLIHPDGPHPWLAENLVGDFIPAWVDRIGGPYAEWDLSVITNPDSRWNNFYLEGLRHLLEAADLDGIYVDDTALDARSVQRARRLLDTRPGRLIDLHSWNHFNEHAGFANNLTMYAEILPYLDRLWLGEGFNAGAVSPDFWLVEMSGLPFGRMSEMLDGANPWRGLVFGETARLGWSGDPRAIWKAWDEFGLTGTRFMPWCAADVPVRTGRADVLATVYRRHGRSFVALGSWAADTTDVTLDVDWKALDLDSAKAAFYAPPIAGLQPERRWRPGESIPVAPGRGWFLVVDEQPRTVAQVSGR